MDLNGELAKGLHAKNWTTTIEMLLNRAPNNGLYDGYADIFDWLNSKWRG